MTEQESGELTARLARAKELNDVLLANNPDGIAMLDSQGRITVNRTAEQMFGTDAKQEQELDEWTSYEGIYLPDTETRYPPDQTPLYRAFQGESCRDELMYCRTAERPEGFWISCTARPLDGGGAIAVFRDVSDRKRLEDDLSARNNELAERASENAMLIERLRLAVDELSTPVLEIWEDVLALPVVGVVDTQRSVQMVERLLAEIVARRSRFVIVDLTGVEVIDTSTADRFMKLARAVELLGAECIVTGIQPAVSQTLVELGVEFRGLSTERNLKRALEVCMAKASTDTQ